MSEKIRKSTLVFLLVLVSSSFSLLARAAEPPALAKLSGEEKVRVAKLIEGAKKEGEVVGYVTTLRPDVLADLIPKFRKEYGLSEADFKFRIADIRSDAVITKVTEELRAGVYKTDIAFNGAIQWANDLVARGELMAYNSPQYKYFHPLSVNPEISPANPPYFISGLFTSQSIVYNPKYVKGEIAHWKDALRPEYKGKIGCGDVFRSASYTEAYLPLRTVVGANFFRELAKQDPFLMVSASDLVNKAISGEFPIIVIGSPSVAFRSNLKGANLKLVFPSEGWAVVGRQMIILARAPHPNASKLFVDFFYSEAAQKILMESEGYLTGRLGVKSRYPIYPVPIFDVKGVIPMDWRKVTSKDRDDAREEFRGFMANK